MLQKGTVQVDQYRNLSEAFQARTDLDPKAVAYSQALADDEIDLNNHSGPRPWKEVTYEEVRTRADHLGSFLQSVGVEKGTRVAVLSNTRPEWIEAELGIYNADGTLVTCYISDPAERIGYVLFDSESRVVFAENQQQFDKLVTLLDKEFSIPETENRPAQNVKLELDKIVTFEKVNVPEHLQDKVAQYKDALNHPVDRPIVSTLSGDDEASLIYTSGTTGAPKGVIATHGQHLSNVRQILNAGLISNIKGLYQLLPLAHGFALQLLHALESYGGKAVFMRITNREENRLDLETRKAIMEDMAGGNPSVIPLVPKVLQGMKDGIMAEVSKPGLKNKIASFAIKTYGEKFEAESEGKKPSLFTRLSTALLESPLLGGIGPKVKEGIREKIVGKEFQFFVSGGAPLGTDLAKFFWALDMPVYEGYGSTESNVPVTCNRPGATKIGSVGQVLDKDIKIEFEDGELIVSGPNLAKEYYNRPVATAKAWDADHRLHTGDRAEVDEDGYVYIRGRMDDMIVTSNGRNIEPEPIEKLFTATDLVVDSVIVGQGRPDLVALAVLKEENVRKWAAEKGLNASSDLLKDTELLGTLKKEILSRVNDNMEKKGEHIQALEFIPQPEIGNGMTATFKLQKKLIRTMYADLIENMYKNLEKRK